MFAFVPARSKQEAKEPPRPVLPHLLSPQTIPSLSLPHSHLIIFLINGGQALPTLPLLPSSPSRLFVGIILSLRFLICASHSTPGRRGLRPGEWEHLLDPATLGVQAWQIQEWRGASCWKLQNYAGHHGDGVHWSKKWLESCSYSQESWGGQGQDGTVGGMGGQGQNGTVGGMGRILVSKREVFIRFFRFQFLQVFTTNRREFQDVGPHTPVF